MLIRIANIDIETADIRLTVPAENGGTTVYLSTTKEGRAVTLPAESWDKLSLFLAASGRLDLDGPGFQRAAFERAADLQIELAARNSIRHALNLDAQLKAADSALTQLTALQNGGNQGGPAKEGQPTTSTAEPVGKPTLVPPRPPISDDDFNPDPSIFLPKPGSIPRSRSPFDDL